jgi:hypothetical protein
VAIVCFLTVCFTLLYFLVFVPSISYVYKMCFHQ